MKTKLLRILAVILLLLLGFGGLYGAWMLISDPSGGKFGFPPELLVKTPFSDYLIPGIILLLFNGLLPLFITIIILLNRRSHSWWIMIQGSILVGWLTSQLIFNPDFFVPEMHYPFYVIGVLLLVAGLLLVKDRKR